MKGKIEVDLYVKKSPEELQRQLTDEYKNREGFIDKLRYEFDGLFKKIDEHPFLTDLEKGKLPIEKYKTYAIQNSYYVYEVARNVGAAMMSSYPITNAYIFSVLIVPPPYANTFADLYVYRIAKNVGVTEEDIENSITDPTIPFFGTRAYTDFMFKNFHESPEMAISSFIGCPWSYTERELGGLDIAKRIAVGLGKHYGASEENVKGYTLEEGFLPWHMKYLKICKDVLNFAAKMGGPETQIKIKDNFRRCLEYEYVFWDQAYNPAKYRFI